MNLKIAEIFTSIQGEGLLIGTPSTFIRVSGCNLRCDWCDTKYASWHPEGPVMSLEKILETVHDSPEHFVLTGGEPMLFDAIEPLCHALRALGKHITIETAGTVFRELPCDLMSISPKLANSVPQGLGEEWVRRHEATRLDLAPLQALVRHYDHQLKFVVSKDRLEEDPEEIRCLLQKLEPRKPGPVLLMPESTNEEDHREGLKALGPVCLCNGWRLSPRLHIELFGNTRGT